MSIMHVVSVSGGKDSAATAVLALETQPRKWLRFVSVDTGNEHEDTLEYIAYMGRHLGIDIYTLPPRDFSGEIARKREYVIKHWPRKGVKQEDIDRIEYWEAQVAAASRRGVTSFFADPDRDSHLDKRGIRKAVEWSKTKRGGQLMDWIRITEEPKACQSEYGLCE